MKKIEEVKIYRPKEKIIPEFKTNTLVDNYTAEDGNVYSKYDESVMLAKKEVDANHK
ncbi:MAG: hypothetical protein IJ424_04700 [Oscillospiraceae bacterium]|nr:hypothetical protein [Oscillospiraceae bacterium]